MTERWWIGRDDGEIVAGPYETREAAEKVWRAVYDTSETLVTPGRSGEFYREEKGT